MTTPNWALSRSIHRTNGFLFLLFLPFLFFLLFLFLSVPGEISQFAMPFVQAHTHSLHYADSHPAGPPTPSGLPIIFIHGLGSSQNYYFPVLPHLTETHRCITIDTYGAARSPYTNDAVSIPSIADDVIGVLDSLNIPQAVVVGHSMGGLVVTELGARYPNRVLGVVAIGPTHPSEMLVSVMGKRAATVLEVGMESMANTIPSAAVGSRSTPLQRAFIRELLLGQDPKGYAALCRAIASAQPADYAAVRAPFLLIAGEEDKSASIEGCQHIFQHVSSEKKSLEVLKGVGHWHCIEAADEVGQLIAQFAKGITL
ncbi:Alpha/beta hydrolase fold-1 [Penicillium macrosclerotiorum]|uniref:Alpha/beta hydrolase fold-1 n=1 Tax=Penicillium macrosclerotiorum TaxID=303699 RepID=UPI002546B30D|nr:Alpha/beta hydrolase fold-1 [Penicillium macrosclerotiorum]KAJ5676259.1 Alpha/beta hydrolase fold-1 [Penicillium macrosclerotiorum]